MADPKAANFETIKLDGEGNWFQGPYPILHDRTCKYLHKHISVDDRNRFFLSGEDKPIYIEVEDVPYWVMKLEKTIVGYLITLTDETIELLNPELMWIGKGDALYCRVKQGQFSAKFQRHTHVEIANTFVQRGSKFYLPIGKKEFLISKGVPAEVIKFEKEQAKATLEKEKRVKQARQAAKASAKKATRNEAKKVAAKKSSDAKKLKKAAKKKPSGKATKVKLVKQSAKKKARR